MRFDCEKRRKFDLTAADEAKQKNMRNAKRDAARVASFFIAALRLYIPCLRKDARVWPALSISGKNRQAFSDATIFC